MDISKKINSFYKPTLQNSNTEYHDKLVKKRTNAVTFIAVKNEL